MSLFGRLFGPRAAPPVPNAVVIPEEIAAGIRVDGGSLQASVEDVLRSYLEARSKAPAADPTAMPFWLDRGKSSAATDRSDIEDELRNRVIERHSGEGSS